MSLITKELSPGLWKDFEAYFEYKGSCSGCWCMNHRLPIGLNFEGEAAKLAMKQLIESEKVFGLLAYREGDSIPVGWCSLDRRKTLPGHDCIEEDINCDKNIWSIHCITSRSDCKNQSIEEKLSKDVVELARKYGAIAVEAYPEPSSKPGQKYKTWNVFNGYQSYFEDLGFKKVPRNYGTHEEFYFPMIKEI